jgi:hypothetical protein
MGKKRLVTHTVGGQRDNASGKTSKNDNQLFYNHRAALCGDVLKKPFAGQFPSQPSLLCALKNKGPRGGKLDAVSFIISEIGFLLSTRPATGMAGAKLGQGDFGREISLIFAAESLRRASVFLNRIHRSKLRPKAALVHDRDIEGSKRLLSDLAEGSDTGQAHSRRNPLRLDERTRRIRASAHNITACENFVELTDRYHFHTQRLFALPGKRFAAFRPQTIHFDPFDRTDRADRFSVAARLIASADDTEDAGIFAA